VTLYPLNRQPVAMDRPQPVAIADCFDRNSHFRCDQSVAESLEL
jgi:hypothetical protein